jgi:uncharacterized protein (TIGR02217 family)
LLGECVKRASLSLKTRVGVALGRTALDKSAHSGSITEVRTITKPLAGTCGIYKDAGEPLAGWSFDVTADIVTFTAAPAAGVAITADFELDMPVRFDAEHMAATIESFKLHRWQQIPIVELRT